MQTLFQSKFLRELLSFSGLLALALFLMAFFIEPSLALDASTDGFSFVSDATGGEDDVVGLAQTIVNYFLGFLAIISVGMIIYAGVLYVTSAGAEEPTTKAKKIITYAVIGIIIIFISFALINTVFQAGTGGSSTGV